MSTSTPVPPESTSSGEVVDLGIPYEELTEWAVHQRAIAAITQSDGHLYHYTDIGGLKGILDYRQLWGTHAAYLNDSQEFAYGVESICAMINDYAEWVQSPESGRNVDASLLVPIMQAVRDRVLRSKEVLGDPVGPFVTCFSLYGDELSQWRGYANGGYAICFEREALQQLTQVEAPNDDRPLTGAESAPQLHAVEYIPKKQSEKVAEIVDEHIIELLKLAKESRLEKVPELQRQLIHGIVPLAASIKHHAFVGEAEERLIAHTSETFYTPSKIGLIPRVRFSFEPAAVRKVIVGPSPLDDVKLRSLMRYLQKDFAHVEVVSSQVPYREL